MDQDLKALREELRLVREDLRGIRKNTEKMSTHIDHIEYLYDYVRTEWNRLLEWFKFKPLPPLPENNKLLLT